MALFFISKNVLAKINFFDLCRRNFSPFDLLLQPNIKDYLTNSTVSRHFGAKHHHGKNRLDWVIKSNELLPMLEQYSILLPKKRHYYIETLYSHYEHTHYSNQLDATREIISKKYPDYLATYDEVLSKTSGYMFNMGTNM